MSFKVGDVVEVTYVYNNCNAAWVGRRLAVIGFTAHPGTRREPKPHTRVRTAPSAPRMSDSGLKVADGWHPAQLRKIDPPDWEAPRLTEKEVVT